MKILIADDDPDDLGLFKSALMEIAPHSTLLTAGDGVQLMQLLHSAEKPGLVVLDLNMPLKSGKECLYEIKQDPAYAKVPVVILTTSKRQADVEECLLKGVARYYVKPYSFNELKFIIKEITEEIIN
ncbi:MAG: response regulator [Bacteroidota bacterium]